MSRLINTIASRVTPQFQQDVKARIAQVVTSSDAQTVEEVMAAIADQARRDRHFGDLLHKAGVGAAGLYGMNIQPTDPASGETYP